jgi:hypothetical protein
MSNRKYPLGNYGLSIVLFVLFFSSWILQGYSGWKEFAAEQKEHGGKAEVFGDDGYIWRFSSQTMENWQSEFLQLFSFVILTAILIHRGSHESKDNDDDVNERLERMENMLKELTQGK